MDARPGRSGCAAAIMLLFVCCGCPSKPVTPPPAPPTPPVTQPTAPAMDCAALQSQKNQALGELENDKFAEAERLLTEIAAQTPNDPLGPRNLAIARLQLLTSGLPTDAEGVVTAMLAREPDAAVAWWLAARVAATTVEQLPDGPDRDALRQTVVERFERAIALQPDSAALHFELFEALRYSASPEQTARAQRALREAARIEPDNLFALTDLLLLQVETRDGGLPASLARLATLSEPLQEGIRNRARVDVREFIDAATQAAAMGNWPAAMGRVRALSAVLRPEELAQSDRRRLTPHPLEFARHDYLPATCPTLAVPTESPTAPTLTLRDDAWSIDGLGELRDVAIADFNLDGRPDVALLGAQALVIWEQLADGGWRELIRQPLTGDYRRLIALDLDRDVTEPAPPQPDEICQDADPDLILYGPGGVLALRNDRDDSGQRSLVGQLDDQPLGDVRNVAAAAAVDFDHDGDLDLVLVTDDGVQLWSQQGGWRFVNVSHRSQLPEPTPPITAIVAVDLDRDVDVDLLVSGPDRPVGYLENLRHGELRYRDLPTSAGFRGMGALAVVEADGNVSWDLIGSGLQGLSSLLSDTPDRGRITFRTAVAIADKPGDRLTAGDLNNDGHVDLVAWSAAGVTIHLGRGDGTFIATPVASLPAGPIAAVALGDIDGDGALDLFIAAPDGLSLYRNQPAEGRGWLSIRTRGAEDEKSGRVNQYNVGGLVEIRSGGRYQARVIDGPVTHFGLGADAMADSLRVLWTNGVPQVKLQPQTNQAVCERMALKGSCPYLYTWTGKRFEFFTDLLWAAPLGLQFAEGVLAPSRPWEYLLVPGEALQPRDGRYVLQITEELWEAAYFDQVELIAIDHPADVEVFSNEKVGPPDIAELKVHTVRQRRSPVSARDQRGRDVLDQVRDIDGVYLKTFDQTFRQGLTEPHYLELDRGPLDNPQQITLFLTGWIYPTDTSLNIALSQDPDLDGPRPPSLWTPDANGGWREVRPFLGFPGGKIKTIAVDLSGVFTGNDHRLRIATTHEIYWDAAFFTVDEPPAEVRMTPLDLVSADLHPRGFSQPHPPRPNAPETYDYGQVSTIPKWPPMGGRFTRFGDVTELLTATDDRLLVMAAGDEVTVTFAQPPDELPPGWKRDFFLHNVGWDKDADLHTVYGQTVEPLPFVGMSSYPYPAEEGPADTDAYRNYLRTYQTREQRPASFWRWPAAAP
jgi:tetratricopeptide (TPR) repeat protein